MIVEFLNEPLAWVLIQSALMHQLHLEPDNLQGTPPFRAPGA
jgi:hypothetical protein